MMNDMDERDQTIHALKERDKELRQTIERLNFRHTQKNEHTQKNLHNIRVKLASLKWTTQHLNDAAELKDEEHKDQLQAITHTTAELGRMVEDATRELEDPS